MRSLVRGSFVGALVCVVLAGAIGCARAPRNPPASRSTSVVPTSDGPVMGAATADGEAFLGVPYAAPPVGNLRWRPPQPAPERTEPLKATRPGRPCSQPSLASSGEDCLYLNIYSPDRAASARLPVILWLHGGSFLTGQGADVAGSALAARGKVVVVTLNYRLGALGFLSLPAMTESEVGASPGDFGLLDQQAGLRWIKRNIASFGGDPAQVTLMGESAGGVSVCANLTSPPAAGLFRRAISESGCAQRLRTRSEANTQGEQLGRMVGCPAGRDQMSCLRAVPAADLVAAGQAARASLTWEPVVGTPTLPSSILAAFGSGSFAKVPVLIGTNRDEGGLFAVPSYDSIGRPLTSAGYLSALQAQFGSAAALVAREYTPVGSVSAGLALARAIGDGRFSCRGLSAADQLSRSVPTYAYEFGDTGAPAQLSFTSPFPLGAYHGAEIQYLFPRPNGKLAGPQASLSATMIKYWSAFASAGNPNGAARPAWPAYAPGSARFLSLLPGGSRVSATFPADHHCEFWKQLTDA